MSVTLAIAEWRRAEDSRQVAHLCLQHGFYADAVSRSYYAVLHAAKAALALYDVASRRHRALSNLFGHHIVMTGMVERHWGSVVGRLADLRRVADYDVSVVFSESDAARSFQQADGFVGRIRALLTDSIDPGRLQQRS